MLALAGGGHGGSGGGSLCWLRACPSHSGRGFTAAEWRRHLLAHPRCGTRMQRAGGREKGGVPLRRTRESRNGREREGTWGLEDQKCRLLYMHGALGRAESRLVARENPRRQKIGEAATKRWGGSCKNAKVGLRSRDRFPCCGSAPQARHVGTHSADAASYVFQCLSQNVGWLAWTAPRKTEAAAPPPRWRGAPSQLRTVEPFGELL